MAVKQDVDVGSGVVEFRPTAKTEVCLPLTQPPVDALLDARPWRTFRWYKGQQNYLGSYWSATERRHLMYESRNELAHLVCVDFDRSVTRILTQPFQLQVVVNGKRRQHTPDFLLLEHGVPVVVDVTTEERARKPKVAFLLAWTRELIESLGWRYDVLTELDEVRRENLRFLAGYRRDWLVNPALLAELRSRVDSLAGSYIGDVHLDDVADALVRPVLLHMLWNQELVVDLNSILSQTTMMRAPS